MSKLLLDDLGEKIFGSAPNISNLSREEACRVQPYLDKAKKYKACYDATYTIKWQDEILINTGVVVISDYKIIFFVDYDYVIDLKELVQSRKDVIFVFKSYNHILFPVKIRDISMEISFIKEDDLQRFQKMMFGIKREVEDFRRTSIINNAASKVQAQWRMKKQYKRYQRARVQIIFLQRSFRKRKNRLNCNFQTKLRQIGRLHPKRSMILQELFDTEFNYINTLSTAISAVYKPLLGIYENSKSEITTAVIHSIFGNMEEILSVHVFFLDHLRTKLGIKTLLKNIEPYTTLPKYIDLETLNYQKWNLEPGHKVGDAFEEFSLHAEVPYILYCVKYDDAKKNLLKCKKHTDFMKFLENISHLKHLKRQDIESLLISPVQRIPRYELLLRDLIKNTWSTHPDYESLNKALLCISKCAKNINRAKSFKESEEQIKQLKVKIRTSPLHGSKRMYIGEGKINYCNANSPKMREVYVFALSDQILITEQRDSKISNKKFKFIENLPLENALVEANIEDAKRLKNYNFKIKVKTTSSMEPIVYNFQAETLESFNKWINDIQEAVGSCALSKIENKTSDISELLNWTEDELGYSMEAGRNRSPSTVSVQRSMKSIEEDYTPSNTNSRASPEGSRSNLEKEKLMDHRSASTPISPLRVGSRFSIDENKSISDDIVNSKPDKLHRKKPSAQK